jgi:hypothetical protein
VGAAAMALLAGNDTDIDSEVVGWAALVWPFTNRHGQNYFGIMPSLTSKMWFWLLFSDAVRTFLL